jgi:hypothetical protein
VRQVGVAVSARLGSADVVDDDFRALSRKQQGVLSAETATGAGDDCYSSVEDAHELYSFRVLVCGSVDLHTMPWSL